MNFGNHQRVTVEQRNAWLRFIFYVVLLLILAALAMYAYLGTFTRYMADDYCTAASLKDLGFWKAQTYWWQNWSGRYSFTFLVTLVELFGLRIVPVLPAIILLLWWASFVWALYPLLQHLRIPNSIPISALGAGTALWITYRSIDDYPEIVFWQTGILTYPPTAILFLLGIGIALRRSLGAMQENWWRLVLWFLFAFVAGGFSETGVVLQIALLSLLLLFILMVRTENKKTLSSIALASLLGSIVSLLMIALAPGNLARSGNFQNIPALLPSLWGSFVGTLAFLPNLIRTHTFIVAFGFIVGSFLAYCNLSSDVHVENRSIGQAFVASLLMVEASILAGIAPAYLLRGGVPPERVLLFPYFLTACTMIYWGYLSAMLLWRNLPNSSRPFQRWISGGILLLLVVWGVVPVLSSQVQLIPILEEYSAVWDQRDEFITSAARSGETTVVVDDITRMGSLRKLNTKLWLSGDFETKPENWINQCAAQYYGVDQVIAE